MPNHIQNRLFFSGDPEEIQKCLIFIKTINSEGEEIQMDFNKIIPMPEELNIDSDGWIMPLDNKFSSYKVFKEHLDEMSDHFKKHPQIKDHSTKNFLQGISNYLNYGHATWYSWSVENWGTKWNAYGQPDKRNSENTIFFETAWSAPIKIITKLSELFPSVLIELSWADEDSGCNTGKMVLCGGMVTYKYIPENASNEGYELFLELHPDCDYIKLIDGKYQYVENE